MSANPIPGCALGPQGRREQHARYQQLAQAVRRVDRARDTITVQFDHELDRALLEQALAVERQCCPFFVFAFDDAERRLDITMRQAEQVPALEALAAAFEP